ncbi:hypothetical protein RJ640_000301 [Escallonia rubra]|uniref:Polygalacturonase QRT3 n=1 Tax=Escallonia rubra TaxID=112253 RepID=A0AA88RMA6_9ASTE|nr:hypothetical protein RJ640_000301 [Escallonia rubra]
MGGPPSRAICFLLVLLLVQETRCALRQQKLYEFQTKVREKVASSFAPTPAPMPPPVAPSAIKSSGRVYYPTGYGADPTGVEDSTDAILDALSDALEVPNVGLQLLPGVHDLGGVIVDLQGGSYKVSKPIRLPAGAGNLVIEGGTLRASDAFPGDRHLIELWSPTSQKLQKTAAVHRDSFSERKDQSNGIYYEDITFRDILFDSSYQGGGLLVIDSARVRVNNCFFIHFTTEGILVQRGHETFISDCFLGEHSTVGGDRGERNFSGTAIDLASTDNAVTDVAIFSAATGIILRGQANIVTGIHCYNKATYFGGVGILVKAAQTRLANCYMDYNAIVIEDPAQVHVTNGFFLGGGNVLLKSVNGLISGLNIVNNMFSGDKNNMLPIVNLNGEFTNVDQVVIDHNNVVGMSLKSTVGKLSVAGNGTKWVADFSSVLVFPNRINHVQYSFYVQGVVGFPAHAVTNVSNNVVVVESEKVVNGVVSVEVDQHNMVGEGNFLM